MPGCFLVSHAGQSQYMVEVKVKHQLEILRSDSGEVMHFDTVDQAGELLRKFGFETVTLRLTDPYDEFGPGEGPSCREDMTISLGGQA